MTTRHGTIRNVKTNQDVNSLDNQGFRGSLLWKATDTLSFTLQVPLKVRLAHLYPRRCEEALAKRVELESLLPPAANTLSSPSLYQTLPPIISFSLFLLFVKTYVFVMSLQAPQYMRVLLAL